MKLTFFQKSFKILQETLNVLFNILKYVKNTLKQMATEQGLYAQVVMLFRKDLKITEENIIKVKINSSCRTSLQHHSVGQILILIVLKFVLARVNLIFIRKYFKGMVKHKIKIYLKCLQFQLENAKKRGGNGVSH